MKEKKGHWSVKNELDFDLRAIDTTASDTDKDLNDYEVNSLKYFSDYDFEHNSTTSVQAPKLEDGIDYQVVMARKKDAYPVTFVEPELQDDNVNLEDTVISKEMLADSAECLNLLRRYLSGEVSKLTSGLHLLLSKNADPVNTGEFDKQVKAFVSENYSNMKLSGTLPDNIELIESYLRNFPNHWLKDQSVFYVYRAAYADLDENAKQELKDYGTINIVGPDDKTACDLKKGENGGYKVEIKTLSKSNASLNYQDGSFVFNDKVTLKPVFVSRKEIYDGVHLKSKIESKDNNSGADSDDVMVVLIGSVLNDIVIAIPDEIDLTKQNTASPDGTPVTPSWGYKAVYIALAIFLLTLITVLVLWARYRASNNKINRSLFTNDTDRKENKKLLSEQISPENITFEKLEKAMSDGESTLELDGLLKIAVTDTENMQNLRPAVEKFVEKYPKFKENVEKQVKMASFVIKQKRKNNAQIKSKFDKNNEVFFKEIRNGIDLKEENLGPLPEPGQMNDIWIYKKAVAQRIANIQHYEILVVIIKQLDNLGITNDSVKDLKNKLDIIKNTMTEPIWKTEVLKAKDDIRIKSKFENFIAFQRDLKTKTIEFERDLESDIDEIKKGAPLEMNFEKMQVDVKAQRDNIVDRCNKVINEIEMKAKLENIAISE